MEEMIKKKCVYIYKNIKISKKDTNCVFQR